MGLLQAVFDILSPNLSEKSTHINQSLRENLQSRRNIIQHAKALNLIVGVVVD
jgi:hypothetical protein